VPLVGGSSALAGGAERLAWAGAGPDFAIVRPSGVAEGERPDCSAGEEMHLSVSDQIGRSNIDDASVVNVSWANKSS
jgi:hypothetical protein